MRLSVKELMGLIEYIKECEEVCQNHENDQLDELRYSLYEVYNVLSKKEKSTIDESKQDRDITF